MTAKPDQEYRADVEQAVIRAVFEASIVEAGGRRRAVIRSGEAVDALLTVIASVVASGEDLQTPRARREFADQIARSLQRKIGAFQAYAATNGTPFQTVSTRESARC